MIRVSCNDLVAGVDEVGRGCLAGAVIAGAVIFPANAPVLPGLTDSKKLSARQREYMASKIQETAIAWAIGRAEPTEIDRLNILQASLLAMQRAYCALEVPPDLVLVDGKHCPELDCHTQAIIGGDLSTPCISAGSIIAKVFRDHEMRIAEHIYPGYGFGTHKGYPTKAHKDALETLGPSPLHRLSFKPVRLSAAGFF